MVPGTNYYEVACAGTRTNGAVYYWSDTNKKMYKRNLATGMVSLLFQDTSGFRYSNLRINEETGAVIATNSITNVFPYKVAASVEALRTAPALGVANWYLSTNCWCNGLVLCSDKFYDSSGSVVRQLPTSPDNGSRCERTIATRKRWSMCQATW